MIFAEDGAAAPFDVIPAGVEVKFKAAIDRPGSFKWTTSSPNLALGKETDKDTVSVTGANPSAALGAERLQVDFTPASGGPAAPVILGLTVIRVTITESAQQGFGFDDMDGSEAPHVSIRDHGRTAVHVKIDGGVGSEVLVPVSEPLVEALFPATPAPEVELAIVAKDLAAADDGKPAALELRAGGPKGPLCAQAVVNVYREKAFTLTAFRLFDSRTPQLGPVAFDTGAAQPRFDVIYRQVVVSVLILDGGEIDAPFEHDLKNPIPRGSFQIDLSVVRKDRLPPAQKLVQDRLTMPGFKALLVHDLLPTLFLAHPVGPSDTVIELAREYSHVSGFRHPNQIVRLGIPPDAESISIDDQASSMEFPPIKFVLTSRLTKTHGTNEGIPLEMIGGLADFKPFLWIGQTGTDTDLIDIVAHESGHGMIGWEDLESPDDLMNFNHGDGKIRLRFKPQPIHGGGSPENQWEKFRLPR